MSTQDEEYPEILEDLVEQARTELKLQGVEAALAQKCARAIAERMRKHWGGQRFYIPKGDRYELSKRDEEMYRAFNGSNYAELCRRYDLSDMQVRRVINSVRTWIRNRNQLTLFQAKPLETKPIESNPPEGGKA